MNERLKHKLMHLPTNSGVYIYKDREGKIIYIGKAKNLKNRIKSYFNNIGRHEQFKTEILVRKIYDLEYIITDTELEALLLEANLIGKHKPKYNIMLKDDKSYPYIRITNELYPRIFITRKIVHDGSTYIGPYTSVRPVRHIINALKKIYMIRNCSLNITEESIEKKRHKVCLDYHIKICAGVCKGYVSPEDYKKNVDDIIAFVKGNDKKLIITLKKDMLKASEELRFEDAAKFRDHIKIIEAYQDRQKVENADPIPKDYIALAMEDNDACCVVFSVRNGCLISRNHYFLNGVYKKKSSEVLEEFIKLYYQQLVEGFPDEIMIQEELEDSDTIKDWISSLKGKSIKFSVPKIGDKSKMIFLSEKNARILLNDFLLEKLKKDYTPRSLQSLKRDLNLPKLPALIECFDISHFAGRQTVASMVCFKNAKPFKSRYRKFKIETVEGIDDFASMREVVRRRYTRLAEEKNEELPDLIMVDGGKGQLSSAVKILNEVGLGAIPVIGLAKRLEEVFLPGESEPEMLPRTSSALKLLQQLRDEAHRFAITFHRNLRKKETLKSVLDGIKGLGPKKKELLIKKFGSAKKVINAPIEEILEVKGITKKLAELIKNLKENL